MSEVQTDIGRRAERRAETFLNAQGLLTVARNIRCRHGELDLVMRDRDTLVFVEVRLRSPGRFPNATASVDRRKQGRLLAAASWFLQRSPAFADQMIRFDVVAYDGRGLQTTPRWIRQAFDAPA